MKHQNELALNAQQEIKSVEEFKFETQPIKGYPEIRWLGKRPFTGTQFYPAQLKERHGEEVNGWINKIFWGDNLQVMSHLLKTYRGQVDLVYIDPPFDSKADYKKKISLKGNSANADSTVFEEKQYSDIWNNDEYLQFMYERLIIIRELLSNKGSIYVHCDWHKSHYLRCIIEEVFGIGGKDGSPGFRNEIIWCYSDAANSKKYWNTKHDNIIFATKTSDWTFHYEKVLRDVKDSTKAKYRYEDDKGRYRLFGKNVEGSPIRWHRDVDKKWEETNPELVFRHYLKDGSLPLDWWLINPVNQAAKEREDYPTQKPEELINHILKASSSEGDLVFDCFMGSGTTQAVAMKLGRRFIGADINLGAIQTTTRRLIQVAEELKQPAGGKVKQLSLEQAASDQDYLIAAEDAPPYGNDKIPTTFYTGFEVYNVNHYDVFRNPLEAKDLLIKALEIQPLSNNNLYDGEKDGRMVKIMPVNRIATRADLNELITNFNYKEFEKRHADNPGKPVESITLVCMGHEPDLAAELKNNVPFPLDVEVVDILRDKSNLEFKRDAEANIVIKDGKLFIDQFYPMNLLQKLSLMRENVTDWKELVESVMIDFNYDGSVFEPTLVDVPEKNELVKGAYEVPANAGKIRVKITDLLSESLEQTING